MPRAHPIHTYTLTYVHISNSRPSRCKDLATTGGAPPPVIGLGTSLSKPSWHHSPPRTFCQSIEFHDHDKLNYHSPAPLASALSFFYLLLFEDIGQRSYRIVRSPALPPVTQLNSYHRTVRLVSDSLLPFSLDLQVLRSVPTPVTVSQSVSQSVSPSPGALQLIAPCLVAHQQPTGMIPGPHFTHQLNPPPFPGGHRRVFQLVSRAITEREMKSTYSTI